MKLISKDRDYYDFFARNRSISDQAYIWERKTKSVRADFAIPSVVKYQNRAWYRGHRDSTNDIETLGFIVWFCGVPIPVISVKRSSLTSTSYSTTEFFYTLESVPEDAYGKKQKSISKRYPSTYNRLETLSALGEGADEEIGWARNHFESPDYFGRVYPKLSVLDMHRKVGSPVFCHLGCIEAHKDVEMDGVETGDTHSLNERPLYPYVLTNPCLAKIEFWKRIDAFEAFKQIERFLANEMAPKDSRMDKPVPDAIKAESHGFDKKSFRREKSK